MKEQSGISKKEYEDQLKRYTVELVKLQEWIKARGLRVVILFEGRDAAGKGGVIKTISQGLNPRNVRIAALGIPSDREKTQWYFQRYVAHLPCAGEMVLFDRSWYNRAGVERVMGFCTQAEYEDFIRSAPVFENMLIQSGIILLKYWFSVSDEVEELRFRERLNNPAKRWKLSPMDMSARTKWVEYSKAKDAMFAFSDTAQSPWYVVNADDKRAARLNTIDHLLSKIPYEDLTPPKIKIPPRQASGGYVRPPLKNQHWIPELWPKKAATSKKK